MLTDALDTICSYGQLWTVIYIDGSAVDGVSRGDSAAVVTSGDPGNLTFLDVRHQCGPEYTTSLEVEMWGLCYGWHLIALTMRLLLLEF
jgi:hypothetical protein